MSGELQPEPSNKESRRFRRWVARGLLGMLVCGPVAGGIIGYKVGTDGEHSRNKTDLELAMSFKRCLADVTDIGSRVVRLSSLPEETVDDCGLAASDYALEELKDTLNLDYPLDAEVNDLKFDPLIQLPTAARLREAIRDKRQDANDFNSTAPILPMFAAGLVGFALPLGATVGVGAHYERRDLKEEA